MLILDTLGDIQDGTQELMNSFDNEFLETVSLILSLQIFYQ